MLTKAHSIPFEAKETDFKLRRFSGWASTWSRDYQADRIKKGAYAKTLAAWRGGRGRVIPLVDQHSYRSVFDALGKLEEAEEKEYGLWTTFSVIDEPNGDRLLKRIKAGIVNALSIGYEIVKSEQAREGGEAVRIITELSLREISAVLWPAQPEALIDAATVKRTDAHLPEETEYASGSPQLRRLQTGVAQLLERRDQEQRNRDEKIRTVLQSQRDRDRQRDADLGAKIRALRVRQVA